MRHIGVMPTGTDAPPLSELLARFDALMADVLACVTDAALKAAGVPWPLRLLLAPLMRRSLARWSGDFSRLVADVRTGRSAESDAGPDAGVDAGVDFSRGGDPAAGNPDRHCGAMAATRRVRSASDRMEREAAHLVGVDFPNAERLPARRATPPDHHHSRPCVRTTVRANLRAHDGDGRRRYPHRPPSPRGGMRASGPPTFFRDVRSRRLRTPISLRIVIENASLEVSCGDRSASASARAAR
jgi:hypothetical protein